MCKIEDVNLGIPDGKIPVIWERTTLSRTAEAVSGASNCRLRERSRLRMESKRRSEMEKESQSKDDGRYIIFYYFEDEQGEREKEG